jgi:hypothetical protein
MKHPRDSIDTGGCLFLIAGTVLGSAAGFLALRLYISWKHPTLADQPRPTEAYESGDVFPLFVGAAIGIPVALWIGSMAGLVGAIIMRKLWLARGTTGR